MNDDCFRKVAVICTVLRNQYILEANIPITSIAIGKTVPLSLLLLFILSSITRYLLLEGIADSSTFLEPLASRKV